MPRQKPENIRRMLAQMESEEGGREILKKGTRSSSYDGSAPLPQSLEEIQMMLEAGLQRRRRRNKPINITSRKERLRDLFG